MDELEDLILRLYEKAPTFSCQCGRSEKVISAVYVCCCGRAYDLVSSRGSEE